MGFSERVNGVIDLMNCSNATLARISGIDPSIVSRFRSGVRHPRPNSVQFIKFCNGILKCAEENGVMDSFYQMGILDPSVSQFEGLRNYLLDLEENELQKSKIKKKVNTNIHSFGMRLTFIMNMLGISNVRLARTLNVDTSLISRFRNGLRTPLANKALMKDMAVYFYKLIKSNHYLDELSQILNVSLKDMSDEEVVNHLIHWLSREEVLNKLGTVDQFLERMDSLGQQNILLSEYDINQIIASKANYLTEYIGTEGLRNAVIRFLFDVAHKEQPNQLKFFSDQSINWVVDNPEFLKKWRILMRTALLKGNKITVIHDIERDSDEMFAGLERWLPMYMIGSIEGYYFKNVFDGKFSHTLFVAPGEATLHSSIIRGTEDEGLYHYVTEQGSVDYYEKQFDALLNKAKPLIRVYNQYRYEEFQLLMNELTEAGGEIKRLLLSPGIETIPAELLRQILLHNEIAQDDISRILEFRDRKAGRYEKILQKRKLTDLIAFPEDEVIFSGKVELKLPDLFMNKRIFYRPEEYAQHIEAFLEFLDNDNYNMIPLPEQPFSNIQIMVNAKVGAFVQKVDDPITISHISHPLMSQAIGEYIDLLAKRSDVEGEQKSDVVKYLRKYLL